MEYAKDRNKDTSFVSVNTLIQTQKYDTSNETGKEVQKNEEPGLLARIISGGLTGAAWVIEKAPSFNFVPVPGFGFMQNFIKGMMVGSIERLSNEKVERLWQIIQNTAKAVTSIDYMKAYFWGFLRGFFGDFIMIWELPGTIKSTVIFIENLITKIKELSREDLREFAGRLDKIKSYLIEESSVYINNILQDIKAGKSSELIIETLKTLTNFSQDAGKSVGGQLTGVVLNFFSKDHKELGKDLGGFMGELSGTVAFTALLAAITAGVGAVWGGVRAGIKTVAEIIGKGVGQAVKAIGTVFKNIGRIFGTFIDGVRAVIKGFGNGASKLFKGIKGKLDEVLVKVKGLIDDVVEKLYGKYHLTKEVVATVDAASMARKWQGTVDYPGIDDWTNITIKKGTKVWGGAPGQSNFYTTEEMMQLVGNDATKLNQGLQIGKGSYSHYRPGMTQYEVTQDIIVGSSKALANPQYGPGGFAQYFIPNFNEALKPIQSIIMTNR